MQIDLSSPTSINNMSYLGLNAEQYLIHCKIMGDMRLAPQGMRTYCNEQSRKTGFHGDGFACWVAEYIKNHPQEVAHLR